MENEIIFNYEVVMFMVNHIESVDNNLSDMEKLKMVVNFLEQNNLKTK